VASELESKLAQMIDTQGKDIAIDFTDLDRKVTSLLDDKAQQQQVEAKSSSQ
jgi:hypothetical protein